MKHFWAVALIFILAVSCTASKSGNSTSGSRQGSKQATTEKVSYAKIPGLMPVDVYQNMEGKGFTTKKNFSDNGNLWTSTYAGAGISYSVGAFSHDASSVESVQATARVTDVTNKNISAALPFFLFLSSLPYDGSNPTKVGNWLRNNFNNDKSSVTISNVEFTINAPSDFARTLVIEHSR